MEGDGRVAPPQVNYDNVLPLAIESRSNRREFLPVNGQTFSNSGGSTIIRIDVNADSMLDATHSYLECVINNTKTLADNKLSLNPFTPSWIQRLRIESGGVVLEDINEYSRLYAMLVLNQCPKEYVKNNLALLGLYQYTPTGVLQSAAGTSHIVSGGAVEMSDNLVGGTVSRSTPEIDELHYAMSASARLNGPKLNQNNGDTPAAQIITPTAGGLSVLASSGTALAAPASADNSSIKMCIPLVSGFLNMDKYIPLVMMNAGFTIELTLCDANRIGVANVQEDGEAADYANAGIGSAEWSITGCKYVAHLIDLDRMFYDRLRMVMESSGGVLQLAGQSYRHFSGTLDAGTGQTTITLPARVKSVKSIFGTFIASAQIGQVANYDTSVFQSGGLTSFRFEIGSVRYPQTDITFDTNEVGQSERESELDKAFGKIGDYQHQKAYSAKHTTNGTGERDGSSFHRAALSAFFIGYDFEAFQRVALEAGINTADRSLPINCILNRPTGGDGATAMRADFFVLVDAIFFINLDGTASVSY
tara:strand:+ start:3037 stop:4635 length:1599 start_codon:yes stop_codon:yes gene_type:complete